MRYWDPTWERMPPYKMNFLPLNHFEHARRIGFWRQNFHMGENDGKTVNHQRQEPTDTGERFAIQILGALGECMAQLVTGFHWNDTTIFEERVYGDLISQGGEVFEVRTTRGPRMPLWIDPHQPGAQRKHILVVGQERWFSVIGWYSGEEAMERGDWFFRRRPVYGPTYNVPQEELRRMEELFEVPKQGNSASLS